MSKEPPGDSQRYKKQERKHMCLKYHVGVVLSISWGGANPWRDF